MILTRIDKRFGNLLINNIILMNPLGEFDIRSENIQYDTKQYEAIKYSSINNNQNVNDFESQDNFHCSQLALYC